MPFNNHFFQARGAHQESAFNADAITGYPAHSEGSIIFFATQLAVMVDTGVPLVEALDAIVEQTRHTGMKELIGGITEEVKSGVEFSTALEKFPRHFNTLFVALMRASEATGTMGQP